MPKSSSSFALAAKILFDSAQKVGAVGKRGTKLSTRSLHKVREGTPRPTLDRLTTKVTNFLDSKKKETTLSSIPRTNLDLRFLFEERKPTPHAVKPADERIEATARSNTSGDAPHRTTLPEAAAQRGLELKIPMLAKVVTSDTKNETGKLKSATLLEEGVHEKRSVDMAVLCQPVKERARASEVVGTPMKRVADKSTATRRITLATSLIVEDKPLFDDQPSIIVGVEAARDASVISAAPTVVPPEQVPSLMDTGKGEGLARSSGSPSISNSFGLTSVVDAGDPASQEEGKRDGIAAVTVESWEEQREKEMTRLDGIRREEEARRQALLRLERHKVLGEEWVAQRSRVVSFPGTGETATLTELNKCKGEEAVQKLEDVVGSGLLSASTVGAAVATILNNSRTQRLSDRIKLKSRILKLVEEKKELHHIAYKVKLLLAPRRDVIELYRALEPDQKKNLEMKLERRAVHCLVIEGLWEEALSILARNAHSPARQYALELGALRSALQLDAEKKNVVLEGLRNTMGSRLTEGRESALLAAQLARRSIRKAILKQASMSPEADEKTFSALMCASHHNEFSEILAEVKKRGLNAEDPSILYALLQQTLHRGEPAAVFEEIERQKQIIGLRPFHLTLAVRSVVKTEGTGALEKMCALLTEAPPEASFAAMKKLLPHLYSRGMWKAIVSVCDHAGTSIKLEDAIPNGLAFYNEALIREGRVPVSSITTSDINFKPPSAKESGGNRDPGAGMRETLDLSSATEEMLVLAKERNWERAVKILKQLPSITSENGVALTLLYNCALSAAVENVEVTEKVYYSMKANEVPLNSTSVNTILNTYSKLSRVEEAFAFYSEVPHASRDATTYALLLSLLAKQNKSKEVVTVFDEAKKSLTKLPASLFAVVLGSTVQHSWADSLRVFQDLVKMHGKGAHEALKEEVFRCLERNGRTAEIMRLNKLLQSKKKKK